MIPILTLGSLIPGLPSFYIFSERSAKTAGGKEPKFSGVEAEVINYLDATRLLLLVATATYAIIFRSSPDLPVTGLNLQAAIGYFLSVYVVTRQFTYPGKSSV